MKKTFCTAIVLAAGSGKRMGTRIAKQYLEIDGKPFCTIRSLLLNVLRR